NDDDEERDFTATPSAGLTGVTLFGPMRFTGLLDTEYVWFQKFRSERSINSTANLRFEGFFDRLRPWATGEFVRTRARQGLEIDVRAQRTAPAIGAGLDWVVGSRTSLALSSQLTRTEYADFEQVQGENLSEQLNNTTQTYSGGVRFELTPLTMLQVDGEYSAARFSGESVRDNESWSVLPRLLFQPDAFISGELMVGFKTLTPKSPELERFAGLITRGELTVSLLDVTRLGIEVERNTEYSFEPLHPYYVQTGAAVTITQQIGGPFDLQVSIGRYKLVYRNLPDPVFGPRGTEQLTSGGFGVGYRLGETIRIGVTGQLEQRRSGVKPDRDYDRISYYGAISYLL
ncbi:MAG: outer membrane beta-barrel protein, partial [Vicinamibacterales bacterium]